MKKISEIIGKNYNIASLMSAQTECYKQIAEHYENIAELYKKISKYEEGINKTKDQK